MSEMQTFKINDWVKVNETGRIGEVSVIFQDGSCCVVFDAPPVPEPYFHPTQLALASPEELTAQATRLLEAIVHSANEIDSFNRTGDPSGYGKMNILTWLGEVVLSRKMFITRMMSDYINDTKP